MRSISTRLQEVKTMFEKAQEFQDSLKPRFKKFWSKQNQRQKNTLATAAKIPLFLFLSLAFSQNVQSKLDIYLVILFMSSFAAFLFFPPLWNFFFSETFTKE